MHLRGHRRRWHHATHATRVYYARGDTSPILTRFPGIRLVHSSSRRHSVYRRLYCGVEHVIKAKVDVKALGEREGKNVANIRRACAQRRERSQRRIYWVLRRLGLEGRGSLMCGCLEVMWTVDLARILYVDMSQQRPRPSWRDSV